MKGRKREIGDRGKQRGGYEAEEMKRDMRQGGGLTGFRA